MRFLFSLLLLSALFFVGCARQGVIVRKTSRPQPFYHSLGIEGSYAFILRDNSGAHYRQLVTPEVFVRYSEGDYFNDLQQGPGPGMGDGKTMLTAQAAAPSAVRVAKVRKNTKTARIAKAKKRKRQQVALRKTRRPAAKKTVRTAGRATRVAKILEAPILVAQIDRCR